MGADIPYCEAMMNSRAKQFCYSFHLVSCIHSTQSFHHVLQWSPIKKSDVGTFYGDTIKFVIFLDVPVILQVAEWGVVA